MNMNMPNKYLDMELNYMKEIREAYFVIKDEDISEDETTCKEYMKRNEIADLIEKQE
jgi:xylose isomerase